MTVKEFLTFAKSDVAIVNDNKDIVMVIKSDYVNHSILSDYILNMHICCVRSIEEGCLSIYLVEEIA